MDPQDRVVSLSEYRARLAPDRPDMDDLIVRMVRALRRYGDGGALLCEHVIANAPPAPAGEVISFPRPGAARSR